MYTYICIDIDMCVYVCVYIYLYMGSPGGVGVNVGVNVSPSPLGGGQQRQLGLYTILPSPILYGSRHTNGGSVRGRILPNGRAIVLQ